MIKKIILVLLMLITFLGCNQVISNQTKEGKSTDSPVNEEPVNEEPVSGGDKEDEIIIDVPGENGALKLGTNKTENYIFYVFKNPAKDYINREYIILVFDKGSGDYANIYYSNRLITNKIIESNDSAFNSKTEDSYAYITIYDEKEEIIKEIFPVYCMTIQYKGGGAFPTYIGEVMYGDDSNPTYTTTGNYYRDIEKLNTENYTIGFSIAIYDYSSIDEMTGERVCKSENLSFELEWN